MIEEKAKEILLKKVGSKIKSIRIEKNISQSELANRIGKERQSLHRVENGQTNTTIWYLHQICDALNVDMCDLLK